MKEHSTKSINISLDKGNVTRRDFIKKTAALGVTAGVASMLPAKTLFAATPKRGGEFRIGTRNASTTDSLDPELNIGTGMVLFATYAMHGFLTETGPGNKLHPHLATNWESTPDAKSWAIHLRRGVEYHNGKTVTAKDVVASINIHRTDSTKSSAKPLLEGIEEIKTDGKDKVLITLKTGNADFPYVLSDYRLPILPATDNGVDWQSHTGAGGYMYKSFEPGVEMRLVRNPNYWRKDRAFFNEVEIIGIAEPTARTSALATGRVDAIDDVDYKVADMLSKNDKVIVEETTGGMHYTFPMRTDMTPFDDNNVRMALKHALNREVLVKNILRGHGVVGNDQPISPNYRFHNPEIEQRNYDPDKAKFYLKKAGIDNLTVELSASEAAFPGSVDAATLYHEHAKKAGINIKVVREPADGYWSNVWLKKSWVSCYWYGMATEDICLSQAYAADAAWNDTFWKHERFNKLLVEARAELNTEKRSEMYGEMQRILRDEGGLVLPMFPNNIWAVSKKVAHGKLEERWTMDGYRPIERWWFS